MEDENNEKTHKPDEASYLIGFLLKAFLKLRPISPV
jgi:hypothetical protein